MKLPSPSYFAFNLFTVRTEPVEVLSRAYAGFDKLSPNGLFALTAKA
ncbi:MAG: hypothetical protein HEQ39_02770 [Rhizobacter sp.]